MIEMYGNALDKVQFDRRGRLLSSTLDAKDWQLFHDQPGAEERAVVLNDLLAKTLGNAGQNKGLPDWNTYQEMFDEMLALDEQHELGGSDTEPRTLLQFIFEKQAASVTDDQDHVFAIAGVDFGDNGKVSKIRIEADEWGLADNPRSDTAARIMNRFLRDALHRRDNEQLVRTDMHAIMETIDPEIGAFASKPRAVLEAILRRVSKTSKSPMTFDRAA